MPVSSGSFTSPDTPIRFQVGEPWWWITPDKRICLYDAAARAALGDDMVSIPSIDGPKSEAQNQMLDRAGDLLAQSTAALLDAVRDEAGEAGEETLLLAYLPTVLDSAAPEAIRANLPTGWASPAFDVLQLEDYDWVIAGDRSATARGIELASERLGYPVEEQHYFSGFALRSEDRFVWPNMYDAIADAKARGTNEIFVWALPQVARDGFTYFDEEEQAVNAFDDVLFPIDIGQGARVAPRFSTNIVTTLSGHEQRNSDWADARMEYDPGPGIRSEAELHALLRFFRARRGSARAFRFRDPFDHSSREMVAPPTATDQQIGIGDGQTTRFWLVKEYSDAGEDVQRRMITRPVPDSVEIAVDGVTISGWTPGPMGSVDFDTPPAPDAVITAGFLFDVPVRFADDHLDLNHATFMAGEIPEVRLVEVREAS